MFEKDKGVVNKQTVTAFVFGIILTVFLSHAYLVYQMRAVVFQNQASINEIVTYINQQIQSSQTQTQQVVSPSEGGN